MESVQEAVALAAKHGVPVMVNPAPVPSHEVDPSLLAQVDILVPNETEAESLTGVSPETPDFAQTAIEKLRQKCARTIIITLGANGSVLCESGKIKHIPACRVKPVDTTAAGDAFIGGLAAGYKSFSDLKALVRFASAVAALAVTKKGAQASLPDRREVEDFLTRHQPALLEQFRTMAGMGTVPNLRGKRQPP
jgi:ribokinase